VRLLAQLLIDVREPRPSVELTARRPGRSTVDIQPTVIMGAPLAPCLYIAQPSTLRSSLPRHAAHVHQARSERLRSTDSVEKLFDATFSA